MSNIIPMQNKAVKILKEDLDKNNDKKMDEEIRKFVWNKVNCDFQRELNKKLLKFLIIPLLIIIGLLCFIILK